MTETTTDPIATWLQKNAKHQNLWRRVFSVAFFATAGLTIITGALTTAVAGLARGYGWTDAEALKWSTILAAATTILASMEKVLRLREKWDLHRNVHMEIELIEIKRGSSNYDDAKLIADIERVGRQYSSQLAAITRPVDSSTSTDSDSR